MSLSKLDSTFNINNNKTLQWRLTKIKKVSGIGRVYKALALWSNGQPLATKLTIVKSLSISLVMSDRLKQLKTAAHLHPSSTSSVGHIKHLTIVVSLLFSELWVQMILGRSEARVTLNQIQDLRRVAHHKKGSKQPLQRITNNSNRETNSSCHLNFK